MLWREKIGYVILFLIIFTFIINLGPINNFLGSHTDKTISFDESIYVVPMEDGGYKTVKSEVIQLGGKNVSREYYTNPSRDTNTTYDHMGVVYIFTKEDKNYCIEVHYFTTTDYNNESFTKELDDRVEDIMANMENTKYNWYISTFNRLLNNQSIEWGV